MTHFLFSRIKSNETPAISGLVCQLAQLLSATLWLDHVLLEVSTTWM